MKSWAFVLVGALVLLPACKEPPPPPPAPTATPGPPKAEGRIAFSFRGNLWIADSDGSHLEQLTMKTEVWFPSMSPSGKKVVFWSPHNKNQWSLNIMNIDGQGLTEIYSPKEDVLPSTVRGLFIGNYPSFTSNEESIVFASDNVLWKVDTSGLNLTTLGYARSGIRVLSPNMTADGKTVYYLSSESNGEYSVWKLDLVSHLAVKLASLEGFTAGALRLSPKNSHLALTMSREGKANLAVYSLPSGPLSILTKDGGSYSPSFSPDGSKLIFTRDSPGGDVQIMRRRMKGDPKVEIIKGISGYSPLWSAVAGPSDKDAILQYEIRYKGKIDPSKPTPVPSPTKQAPKPTAVPTPTVQPKKKPTALSKPDKAAPKTKPTQVVKKAGAQPKETKKLSPTTIPKILTKSPTPIPRAKWTQPLPPGPPPGFVRRGTPQRTAPKSQETSVKTATPPPAFISPPKKSKK